jgi:hypothetical protein
MIRNSHKKLGKPENLEDDYLFAFYNILLAVLALILIDSRLYILNPREEL